MARPPSRPRKRATPSFEAPSDVTSAKESGWVFKSEPAAEATPAPEPPAVKPPATPAPPPVKAAPPVVVAPVIQSESPLRFMWVPLAIGYSTILAMLPQKGTRSGS